MATVDVVIIGGGIAGLFTLDQLVRDGHQPVLLEVSRLGSGQTVSAQGIIHGGLKYSLSGTTSPSALGVKQMPAVWSECLAGTREPDLSDVTLRSRSCLLWRGGSLGSRLGYLGARLGLEVTPRRLEPGNRPPLLADHPGPVAEMDEPVIDPVSLLETLARRHRQRLFLYDPDRASWQLEGPGAVSGLCICHPWDNLPGSMLQLAPSAVVLAAGAGNARLRQQLGLSATATQKRPLHMVMVRGEASQLPQLFGHQVDGAHTRITITSDRDPQGRTVWQLGGQVAEDGVGMSRRELVDHVAKELAEVLPGLELEGLEVSTYRVDRAEAATPGGGRPETQSLQVEGNTLTVFPTKLALAPVLALEVAAAIGDLVARAPGGMSRSLETIDWPRPEVACPPWESATDWLPLAPGAAVRKAA
jgi:glycine/D-amino acid oxidase-like deaminating enzyme